MKKVLILQIKGNSVGGVWFVNKNIASNLTKKNYIVEVLSIRNNPGKNNVDEPLNFKIHTINEKDLWEITRFSDIKDALKNLKIIKTLKLIFKKIYDEILLKKDFSKATAYIKEYNPDYIICAHYQLLDIIPKKYIKRTIMEFHTSFDILKNNFTSCIKQFNKYKSRIAKFVWLTKNTCDNAIKYGFTNSTYIYNPIKFSTKKIADVSANKKLITVSRLNSEEKQVNLMLEIATEVLEKHKDWCLELYGADSLNDECMSIINSNDQIKLMGLTNDVKTKLLDSSIYLLTSSFEGFPLSVIEGYECGLPCVTFNYGESSREQIIDSKTGFIIEQKNIKDYIEKLDMLMSDEKLLNDFSKNSKSYAKNFNIDIIIDKWICLFDEISSKGSD